MLLEPISENIHRCTDTVSCADRCGAARLLCLPATHKTFHRAGRGKMRGRLQSASVNETGLLGFVHVSDYLLTFIKNRKADKL